MSVLSIDFETRATVDLRRTGVYPYAAHAETSIWCMAWAFGDEDVQIWRPGENLPQRICEWIWFWPDGPGEIRAWNAQFERVIWNNIMVKRYGAPPVRLEQWVCSAAEAAAMALPRSLDQAAKVLGATQQKDEEGYALMMRMTRPRKIRDDGTPIWWDEDGSRELMAGKRPKEQEKDLADVRDKLARLERYCQQDVRTERSAIKSLRRLSPKEREIYLLDQRINDRGIQIDVPLVEAAQLVANEGIDRANLVLEEATAGAVKSVSDHTGLRKWANGKGVETESLDKAHVADLLDGDLAPEVRAALEARAEAGRSSIAKLKSMLDARCSDDRARGLLLYHGASTGRWTGRVVQPHNFPRGDVADVESYIPMVIDGQYDAIDLFAHPVSVVSSMLRSMLRSGPGNELIAADFSAIEARVLNWLADQTDIVDMFAKGIDVYKHNATRLYGVRFEDVTKAQRQGGKFQELGCGFGMGAKKAVTAGKDGYGIILTEEDAQRVVDVYRATHSRVVDFWYAAENACILAVENPGGPYAFGVNRNLKAVKAGAYLYIVLPSKRTLCYAAPRVVEAETPWGAIKPQLEFSGVNSYTRQWGRQRAYGGLIVENIVQAVSRDLMAEGMLRLEAAGYPVILSVHDEVVAEVASGFGSVEEFERLLAELPAWARRCPVAAEGWRGERYRK